LEHARKKEYVIVDLIYQLKWHIMLKAAIILKYMDFFSVDKVRSFSFIPMLSLAFELETTLTENLINLISKLLLLSVSVRYFLVTG